MKLGIRTRNLQLPVALRGRIETRIRLSVGQAVADIETVQLTLEGQAEPGEVTCQLALRCQDGECLDLEESGRDPTSAIDVTLWRLDHWLRRRRLR